MKRSLLSLALFASGFAAAQSADTRAVPTYESAGLYWTNPGANAVTGCEVKFRRAGESTWKPGLAMWFDARDNQCRGSLVHLAPDTDYQVEMNLPGLPEARSLSLRTWANPKSVARTVQVSSGPGTLDITEGGSAGGYVVYQGLPGAVLDAANGMPFNVTVNASYVIVRGLVLRGAPNAQFVGDLYNAFLRRGGDMPGVQHWIGQLNSGTQSRDQVRRAFVQSPEFQRRVAAMAAQGCS